MNLYFWKKGKKKQSLDEKIKDIVPQLMEAAPKIAGLIREHHRQQMEEGNEGIGVAPDTIGTQIGKLYDFFNNLGMANGVFEDVTVAWRSGGGGNTENHFNPGIDPTTPDPDRAYIGGFVAQYATGPISVTADSQGNISNVMAQGQTFPVKEPNKNERIDATPKAVLSELETTPRIKEFNEASLQQKIDTLKDKTLLTNQRYANEQIKGLIERLENRKKYPQFRDFYIQFPNTTDSRIDALLKKYKLLMKTTDLFVPTFPKDAIDVMKEYIRQTKLLCDKDPVFYVIAQEKDFKQKVKKNDPILLVQSPFGFYWQILGAWDEEMLLLSEL